MIVEEMYNWLLKLLLLRRRQKKTLKLRDEFWEFWKRWTTTSHSLLTMMSTLALIKWKLLAFYKKKKKNGQKKIAKKIDFWSLFDALPTEENTDNFFLATFHLIF